MSSYSYKYVSEFLKYFISLELEEKGRRKRNIMCKRNRLVASLTPPSGDLACNPSMCPDWESNQQPFNPQAGTQSTEPHQPGL